MNKALREAVDGLKKVAAPFGAVIEETAPAKRGGHLKLAVRLSDGRTFSHAICSTPSDWRSRMNDQSDFKRRLREMTEGKR